MYLYNLRRYFILNSFQERDSVMLGGISPHHEYNDSKSSTETPQSYRVIVL